VDAPVVAAVGVPGSVMADDRRTERRQRHVNYFCKIVINEKFAVAAARIVSGQSKGDDESSRRMYRPYVELVNHRQWLDGQSGLTATAAAAASDREYLPPRTHEPRKPQSRISAPA